MTAQAPDQIFYKDIKLDLVSVEGNGLYTPLDFNIQTRSASTGCWRGYIMRYVITESELHLEGFWFNPADEELPEINGFKAVKLTRESGLLGIGFKYEYKDLSKEIPFNGSILVAKDFIDSEYVHMGFQSPTAYRTVLKFEFKDGIIMNVEDKSKQVEKAREQGDPKGYRPNSMSPEDVNDWIMKRFSLDQPLEPPKPAVTLESTKNEMLEELERLKKLQKGEE
jgi:hypothetical protein